MTKMQLPREELTDKALAMIREVPGCEGVRDVSVAPVEIENSRTLEWHVSVIDPGACKRGIADCAAIRVQDELNRQFECQESSRHFFI